VRADGGAVVLTGAPEDLALLDHPALAGAGARIHDLADVWREPVAEMRWKHDSHFDPEGHRRVAESLAPVLEEALAR
jgi:hypothetical protein